MEIVMNKVIFEILKSNLTKNSIEAVAENKSLKYSPMDCFEDCFNLGRAIAEELNKRNQQQHAQQHQAVVSGVMNFFINMYQNGPTNLTQAVTEDIIFQICSVLDQAQNHFAVQLHLDGHYQKRCLRADQHQPSGALLQGVYGSENRLYLQGGLLCQRNSRARRYDTDLCNHGSREPRYA